MLSKKHRIPAKQIPVVSKRGKRYFSKLFTIIHYIDGGITENQFCIMVSKRVSNKATKRNRIKRRVRSLIYKLLKQEKIPQGQYVILCRDIKIKDIEFDTLYLEIQNLFQKITY